MTGLSNMKPADYWAWQQAQVQARAHGLNWEHHAWPALKTYAHQWPTAVCFILATGPSKDWVGPRVWTEMARRWFTIGVNDFAGWAQSSLGIDGLPPLPRLLMRIDQPQVGPEGRAAFLEKSQHHIKLIDSGGKILVGVGADPWPHTWVTPTFGMRPLPNAQFGLTSTGQDEVFFSRTTVCALHLAALLGFRNICLVGLDHGEGYGNKAYDEKEFRLTTQRERDEAGLAYGALAEWMRGLQHKPAVWQCGTDAAWEADGVRRLDLSKAVKSRFPNLPKLRKVK